MSVTLSKLGLTQRRAPLPGEKAREQPQILIVTNGRPGRDAAQLKGGEHVSRRPILSLEGDRAGGRVFGVHLALWEPSGSKRRRTCQARPVRVCTCLSIAPTSSGASSSKASFMQLPGAASVRRADVPFGEEHEVDGSRSAKCGGSRHGRPLTPRSRWAEHRSRTLWFTLGKYHRHAQGRCRY